MTKPAFTPGPWRVDDKKVRRIMSNEDDPIADVLLWSQPQRQTANARLIAAAPEMYEALQNVKKLMADADTSQMPAEAGARFAAVRWQVNTALAKAVQP